jgi:hypothetical protein
VDLSTATPLEADTELARLHGVIAELDTQRGYASNAAHSLNGERAVYKGRRRVYTMPLDTTLTELALKLADEQIVRHEVDAVREIIERVAELDKQIDAVQAEIKLIDIEYARRPWSRFIAVQNGHLHSSRFCEGGTIRVTTQIGWHPELSGKTEAEAVELLGELLCTHCFPDAPVAWTTGVPKKEIAEGYCDGQGEQGVNLQMEYVTPRGRCPKCKQGTGISKTGKVLKHKLPK